MSRSIHDAMVSEGMSTISTYQDRILHDEPSMHRFLALCKVESLMFSPESSRHTQMRDGVSLFRKIR